MNGDKIWLRLPTETLTMVDQRRGKQTRSEALRSLIDRGLTISPSIDMTVAMDGGVTCTIDAKEAWAIQMAAWHLESVAGPNAATSNKREWFAWATSLRELHAKTKGRT